jgi:hypothetical protein
MTSNLSQIFAKDLLLLRDCTPPAMNISSGTPVPETLGQSEGRVNPKRKRSFWSPATNPVTLPVLAPEVRIPVNAYQSTKNTQMCPYCPQLFQQWQHFGETAIRIHCLDKHAKQMYEGEVLRESSKTTVTGGTTETSTSAPKILTLAPKKRNPVKSVRFKWNAEPQQTLKSGTMRPIRNPLLN